MAHRTPPRGIQPLTRMQGWVIAGDRNFITETGWPSLPVFYHDKTSAKKALGNLKRRDPTLRVAWLDLTFNTKLNFSKEE